MKMSFVLSSAIHVLAAGALFMAVTGRSNSPPPTPGPTPVDPAPVKELSEEELEALDRTIEALEEVPKPETSGGRPPSPQPAEVDASGEASSPHAPEIRPPVAKSTIVPAPVAPAPRVKYASAAPQIAVDAAFGIGSLPQLAVSGSTSETDALPAGESRSAAGLRAPRALFVNVLPADINTLLAAREALALIDLPDRTSYLYDANKVVLCSTREQFLALAERAISIKTNSRIGASIIRDAARPLKAQEGVDAAELAKATVSLVWTIPIDGAILQGQRDAAAKLNLSFEQIIATRGSLELSRGKFARYHITEVQLKDRRLVPVNK